MMLSKAIFTVLLVGATAVPAAAQDKDFKWSKAIPAGQAVSVKTIQGDVSATPASGNTLEVVGRKTGRGNHDAIRIVAEETTEGVQICALYRDQEDCDDGSHNGSHDDDDNVGVDFEVRVPRGVRFNGSSVTGDVVATGLTANVKASSVSGNVRVATTGLVKASSVSGSLDIKMGVTDWEESLSFSTVSGDITLEMPGELNSNVRFSTVSGSIDSDWPITMSGRNRRGGVSGTIGKGGRDLKLSTVSGDVELRKAN
jgi:hypothetical protein